MKRTAPLIAAAAMAVALCGCASGKIIKQQQARIQECTARVGVMQGQVKDAEGKVAAMQSQNKELEGQVSDRDGKLQAQQERIDSLDKSNQQLHSALEANKGKLSNKLADVVKEKDDLARRLAALQKDEITAERARLNLKASRDKLAAELAAAKAKRDELAAAVAAAQAEKDAAQAEKDKTQAQRDSRLAKSKEDLGALADTISKEIQDEKAKIAQDGESIALTLQEPLLFKPQQAKLTEGGGELLDRFGRALQALGPRAVRVEGHCDNSPPTKWELFGSPASRWDLSAARATAVARYLSEHAGLDPRQLMASGFGEFRPVAGNDTPEGRAANRRVVLVLTQAAAAP